MKLVFLNKFIFNLYHWYRRDHINRFISNQAAVMRMNAAELEEFRQQKLQRLLREALIYVPYYRNLAGENLESWLEKPEISRFPILDKKLIRQNFDSLMHEKIDSMQASRSSTSGSTGESLFFMISRDSILFSDAAFFRDFKYMNASPLAPQATLWGAKFDQSSDRGIKKWLKDIFKPFYFFSSYEMTENKMTEILHLIQKKKVEVLTSYPSPLEHLAKFAEPLNLQFPHLKAIISSSEQLHDHQRELFQRVFGVEVFNRYGSREFGCIAHECKCHDRLHIEADHLFIEILDENLDPCPPGKTGELYITNLDNFAMPLIRYRIGDMAEWHQETSCRCGCMFPALRRVEGRSFDLIKDSRGNVVSGTFWTILIKFVSDQISNFQLIQKEIDHAELRLVTPVQLTEEQESLLRKQVSEKLPALNLSITYVDSIPLTRSGKRRFIISELTQSEK